MQCLVEKRSARASTARDGGARRLRRRSSRAKANSAPISRRSSSTSASADGKTQKTLIVSFDGVDAAGRRRAPLLVLGGRPGGARAGTLLKARPALAAKFDADRVAGAARDVTAQLDEAPPHEQRHPLPAPAGSEEDTFRTGAPAPAANGATVPHVAPAAVAAALTADDFFRCLDGLPCDTSKGGFTCQLVIASEARGALLTVADGVVRVDRFPAEPKKDRPKAEMSLWYKTAKLFLKDARGS